MAKSEFTKKILQIMETSSIRQKAKGVYCREASREYFIEEILD